MLTKEEQATNYLTFRHIERVRNLLNVCIAELMRRGENHDQSKLESPEVELFTEYTDKLAGSTYGSDEYQNFLKAIKPALDHHYARNRHHPEYTRVTEIWSPVIGFEASHEVSSFGDVRTIDREIIRPNQGNFFKKGQLLKQYITPKGYARLQLVSNDITKNVMVHRLVAEAFIPNSNNKAQVNHIDGDKLNNRVSNLEWVTPSENLQHAYENDLKQAPIKYCVECPSLSLVAFGCEAMARLVINAGYPKATASGIWNAINHGGKHLDLEFIGTKFESWMNSPVSDMNLLDIMEMLCDWKAASERHHDGNIKKSIEINGNRFNLSPQLIKILENTVSLFE